MLEMPHEKITSHDIDSLVKLILQTNELKHELSNLVIQLTSSLKKPELSKSFIDKQGRSKLHDSDSDLNLTK